MNKQNLFERWQDDDDAERRFWNTVAVHATAARLNVPPDQRGADLERLVAALRQAAGLPPLPLELRRDELASRRPRSGLAVVVPAG